MSRVTRRAVNAAIAAAGGAECLERGRGYFYFSGIDASRWRETAVYVAHLSALSVPQWLAEWRRLRAANPVPDDRSSADENKP